jgi:hypothetical protein
MIHDPEKTCSGYRIQGQKGTVSQILNLQHWQILVIEIESTLQKRPLHDPSSILFARTYVFVSFRLRARSEGGENRTQEKFPKYILNYYANKPFPA